MSARGKERVAQQLLAGPPLTDVAAEAHVDEVVAGV
jgi:hypothetical protein